MAALIRKGVHQKPWTIWIPSHEELMIGKNFFSAFSEGVSVSPKHAVLCSDDKGSWFIKDTSSIHGVFVNNKKIPKGGICEIHNEDSIGLGISEAMSENEYEFIFRVNLARKVHGHVNTRYAHSEQRYHPVAPKECDYESCSTINVRRESEEVIIVEEFSNSHLLDNDSLSDTISNSGSYIYYLTDPDADSQMVPKKRTEPSALSHLLSNILTSVPAANDKVHKNVINGSKEIIPENVTNLGIGPPPDHEGCLLSEKEDNQPAALETDKNKTSVDIRCGENIEVVQNCNNGVLNLNSAQDLGTSAEQQVSDSENNEENNGDGLSQIHVSDNISSSVLQTSNKKAQKKKNASKARKRCYLFTRKKRQKNKTKISAPRKGKLLQESVTSEDTVAKKYHEVRSCSVVLRKLNVNLINGRYVIHECSGVELEGLGKNVPFEHSGGQAEGFKKPGIEAQIEHRKKSHGKKSSDISEQPRVIPELKKTNEQKISHSLGKHSKLLRNYILLKRLENTKFQSSEMCRNKYNHISASSNTATTTIAVTKCPTTFSSNKDIAQQEVNKETNQADTKKIPQQASNKGVGSTKNKETLKRSKHLPNGMSKKAVPKAPLREKNNQEASKFSSSVPGSTAAGSSSPNLKKFVIPKKKTVGIADPCQSNVTVTSDSSQKATNLKVSGTRANVKSNLSTYTIPKRKKSVDDNVQVKKVCTTYDITEQYQERLVSNTSAYGNHFSRKGDATRRLSEGDSHGGTKRSNDLSSSNFPSKRSGPKRDIPRRDFESHQSPNSFVCTNLSYNSTVSLENVHHENKYLTSPSESFCRSPMPREENVRPLIQLSQINVLINDPLVMRYPIMTSPPYQNNSNNNIPFVPQFPDQMQSKVNVLDPRVFRAERSNSLPTYNGTGLGSYQTYNGQILDMDICEPNGSSYLFDCAKSYSSNSTLNNNRYPLPSEQNIPCSVGMTVPINSNNDQLSDISNAGYVQEPTPVTPEIYEQNMSNDYPLSVPMRIPSPPVLSELITTSVTLESVLQQVLSWNVNWLQEQRTSLRPPPVTIGSVKKLQLSYFTFDDYVLSFLQLILLETWQLLFTAWSHGRNDDALNFIITNSSEDNGSIILDCQTVTINIEVPNFPKEGKLLTFELMSKGGKVSKIFGYILKHSVEKKASSDISESLLSFLRVPATVSLLLVNFNVKIKKKEVTLFRDKLIQAHVIYYLKPHLHVIKSLLELPKSPLVKTILTPKKACCAILPASEKKLRIVGNYTAAQQTLITRICKTIMIKDQNPRIITVHGAPGTGKTHLILGILQQLLCVGTKVLITATSDAAVNELGLRIKSLLELSVLRNINFIIVGSPDKFPKDLLPFTLREVLRSCVDCHKQKVRRCEEFETDIQLEIEAFRQSIKDMEERSCPALEIKRTEQELSCKLRQQTTNRDDLRCARANLRDCAKNEKSSLRSQYLLNADIILSTLNNSRHLLEDPSAEAYSFACCIIDEATQSVEPELLQPLIFGMDKIILFGDKDLPPVIFSKASLDYNYELTLSERINSYFTDNGEGSPIINLTEQYRMDPEICMFPSKLFYSNTLVSVPQIKTSHFPLVPYVVFNSAKLNKKFKESNSPSLEETLVKLCKDLLRMLKPEHTIGIILPSNEQQKTVSKVLLRHLDCKKIEINVVDCFQGQEKDVVILPCSTSDGENCAKGYLAHKHKLAIALTRAKRTLIVLGNFETMILDNSMEQLIQDAKDRGLCFDLDTLEEFPRYILSENLR